MPQPGFLHGPPSVRQVQAAILHALAQWTNQIDASDMLYLPGMLVVRPKRTYMSALLLIQELRHQDAASAIDQALALWEDYKRRKSQTLKGM